jgi:hypothetical protein
MRFFWELDENKRIFMGYSWEQLEYDGNLMGTKGLSWVIEGNKRNLMGFFWEFDENYESMLVVTLVSGIGLSRALSTLQSTVCTNRLAVVWGGMKTVTAG